MTIRCGNRRISGETVNVSILGVKASCSGSLPEPGDRCAVELRLPGGGFHAAGVVRRILENRDGLAIEFERLDERDCRQLVGALERHCLVEIRHRSSRSLLRTHTGTLEGARLARTDLGFADLRGALLCETDLTSANLRDADLTDADLRYATLSRAWLVRANLQAADLRHADLSNASLLDALLTRANFGGARLQEADLRRARLVDCCFWGADLRGAKLDGANLRGALYDNATRWPAGFQAEENGAQRMGPA